MKDADVHLLREDGWSLEVLNTLCSLGYELDHYDAASCEGEFLSKSTGDVKGIAAQPHRISLHRQDGPEMIRLSIFRAGGMRAQGHARDCLRALFSACGLRI